MSSISWQVTTIVSISIIIAGLLVYAGIIPVSWFEHFIMVIIGAIIGGLAAFGYYAKKRLI